METTVKNRYRYYCILSDVSCKSVLLTELCWAGGGPIETSFGWCSAQAMEEQVDGAGMGQVALCSAADAYCWQGDYAMAAQDDKPGIAGVEVHAHE